MRPMRLGVYIHVPFCVRKCSYCSFVSFPGQQSEASSENYVSAALSELSVRAYSFTKGYEGWTLFVGGGTPTVLRGGQLERLVSSAIDAMKRLGWPSPMEATVEANPGTFGAQRASALVKAGITRFSIGVQSMVDSELKALGRIHSAEDVESAFAAVRCAHPQSASMDIIVGLPGQTMESLDETLEGVLSLGPDHVSCYALTLEEGTPLKELVDKGVVQVPDDDEVAGMMDAARDRLQLAGLMRYEISNYAKPGHECKHNLVYWSDMPYIGIGAAAHSYDPKGMVRSGNVREVDEYIKLALSRSDCTESLERIDRGRAMSDALILSLRTRAGADIRDIEGRYGSKFPDEHIRALSWAQANGLASVDGHGRISLTEKGLMLSNSLFCKLL